ncbi:hypothetical protein ACOQFO_16780 [Ureibacillus sp. MALMAid1270]|uniref:hypothetical protein n=1 Tax=Ureibacillus sp. MALMAid1270 TaxID=3411629 RepID=UPI003BA77C55
MESSNRKEVKDMVSDTLVRLNDIEIEEVFAERATNKDRRILSGKELANEAKRDLDQYMKLFGLEDLEDK